MRVLRVEVVRRAAAAPGAFGGSIAPWPQSESARARRPGGASPRVSLVRCRPSGQGSRPSCGVAVRAFPPWSALLLLMSGAVGSSSPPLSWIRAYVPHTQDTRTQVR
ncbi:MprA protease, GlyGly-CTERM protein-sorting domain-containing form [Rhodococcus erythropolis]|nr:MprA protease, GlyGly-CTERM protein-sorting domain-containing form [Rhodococcus erythropolis]